MYRKKKDLSKMSNLAHLGDRRKKKDLDKFAHLEEDKLKRIKEIEREINNVIKDITVLEKKYKKDDINHQINILSQIKQKDFRLETLLTEYDELTGDNLMTKLQENIKEAKSTESKWIEFEKKALLNQELKLTAEQQRIEELKLKNQEILLKLEAVEKIKPTSVSPKVSPKVSPTKKSVSPKKKVSPEKKVSPKELAPGLIIKLKDLLSSQTIITVE